MTSQLTENPWAQSFSGQAIDLLSPDPATIRLTDIAVSLSRINRYVGHSLIPWSVASHSLLVESLLPAGGDPKVRLLTLLHDGHEFVLGDILGPIKVAIKLLSAANPIATLEARFDRAIRLAVGLPAAELSADISQLIHLVDMKALALEKFVIMRKEPKPWLPLPDISEEIRRGMYLGIRVVSSDSAALIFKKRVCKLIEEAGLSPMEGFIEAKIGSEKIPERF